ncbi:SipW-cognate class signal peptide [Georgenia satyanarayanai]|uniref:SipW-cognate class signal peptide n=1 Tax=Georgenia satyanarayanai TaxID=860221 RepID=A0A2Y9AIY8_9MICO|nr:SipW-dependent-type signal peptide-containing protein [Georgenia satyanarayanai]PYF99684.1 putative ribosomally synthesized peptide with SipW-like signal peptide [Georgenia satyanarayanai]SSA42529.1 SipW-cognate class signal peptide [Georgenia satyanarayanai]
MTTTRHRTALTAAVAGVAGACLGVGGVSLALWSDSATLGGTVAAGYQSFAVGAPGATVPAPTGTAVRTVGPQEAAKLVRDGELAVPVQVDSVSQGNKGLHYVVSPPEDWGSGVFGSADIALFPVASPRDCRTEVLSPQSLPEPSGLESTPVPSTYSTSTGPVTEHWCLYASHDGAPEVGEYANTARVSARPPEGPVVEAEDTWDAVVVARLDPAAEPVHAITFTSTTFRPGEQP